MDEWAGWGMDAPEYNDSTRSVKHLAELDIDRQRSPSGYVFTEINCQLVVRGWGLVVISEKGVSLQRRTELSSGVVESFGTPWK